MVAEFSRALSNILDHAFGKEGFGVQQVYFLHHRDTKPSQLPYSPCQPVHQSQNSQLPYRKESSIMYCSSSLTSLVYTAAHVVITYLTGLTFTSPL
jgi:hypothetical protein